MASLKDKICAWAQHTRTNWPWTLYQRLKVNNLFTDMVLHSVPGGEGDPCILKHSDYHELVTLNELKRFQSYSFIFDKVLEYAVSVKVLDIGTDTVLLDAAGGSGEYAAAVKRLRSPKTVYCLDAMDMPDRSNGVIRLTGEVSAIPLPDASLDAISCHHSFEHFQGDGDKSFLTEAARLLRPGGKLCIVPFFLCNHYAEIRNTLNKGPFDPLARRIFDPLGTFPGWGEHERFARVYDTTAYIERLMPAVQDKMDIRLRIVLFETKTCPDLNLNSHQPKLNGNMKALVLTKLPE